MQPTLDGGVFGVLIPFLYATNPHTRYLKPIRVSSDQNTRWRLSFHFPLIKDKNLLSPHICQIHYESGISPHTYDTKNL